MSGVKYPPTIERLLSRIEHVNECWIYTGAKGSQGYGKLSHNGKAMDAHRVSWLVHNGDIPVGIVVMHICDVKACVNPTHLKLGTQADNIKDMHTKRRHAHGKSLSDSIKKGWTYEKRKEHSHRLIQSKLDKRLKMAKSAGVPLDWKFCPKCHSWQPMVNFGQNIARSDGVNSYCTPCRYYI